MSKEHDSFKHQNLHFRSIILFFFSLGLEKVSYIFSSHCLFSEHNTPLAVVHLQPILIDLQVGLIVIEGL